MNIDGEPTRNSKTLNGETSLGDSTADDLIISGDLSVAGTSSLEGVLDMNNAKIINVGTPTNSADATNKAYVDGSIPVVTGFLKTDGTNSMGANLNMGSNQIKNVSNASASSDAVNLSQLTAIIPDLTPYFKKDGSVAATGEFDLNSNKITGLANGTAASDAAAFGQIPVAPDLSPYFKKDGSVLATGNFDLNSNQIKNLANGSSSGDAVNLSQLTAVITDVNTNASNITTANSNIATNTSNISSNTSAIATANTNISNNTSAISTANTNISNNTSAISTNTTNIAANTSVIDTLVGLQGNYFKKDGSVLATGNFDLNSNKITNVTDPTANQEVATKKYVDDNTSTSPWTVSGSDIYYNTGNVGIGDSSPSNRLDIDGKFRVCGNMSIADDYGFVVSLFGEVLSFNTNIVDGTATECLTLKQKNSIASNTGFTQLTMRQEYRNASNNNSAVWAINVGNENGSYTGNQTNSSILCLMKDNGSVVVNSSRNNNGLRLRVHGTAGGSSGYSVISDNRIKYHEQNITNALTTVNKLKAQKYQKIVQSLDETGKWIPSDAEWDTVKNKVNAKGQRLYDYIEEIGFIAQDVRKNIPELAFCVMGEEEDEAGDQTPLSISYNDIFAISVQAIQELDKKRKEDNKRINDLNKRLLVLEDKLRNVESNSEKEYIL